MNNLKDGWEDKEVREFIWERICKSEDGKYDFAPLLKNEDTEAPPGPKFAETIEQLKEKGLVSDSRPNYDYYWVKLTEQGGQKCEGQVNEFQHTP
jgi:hypothetical protein